MILQLDFGKVNVSCQVGDIVYYAASVLGTSGTNHHNPGGVDTKVKILGKCVMVTPTFIRVDNTLGGGTGFIPGATPTAYMFQKDKNAGLSGITGYYALTEYRNYATVPVEMFATAVDYVESSK